MKINHIAIICKNLTKANKFATRVLNLRQHAKHNSWFKATDNSLTVHVIEIEEAKSNLKDMHHYYRHVALEVASLEKIVKSAIALKLRVFQMDENGEESIITKRTVHLDFGLRTVFVRDFDGNLWEFVQRGRSWADLWP